MTDPFSPSRLRELHEAAQPGTHIEAGRMTAWSPQERATEAFYEAAFLAMPAILALADRLQEADAVAEAARKFQPILKALRPWEASAKQLSELADYDSELPSILKESSRALYDAVENYNHLNAERHASRTRDRREG